MDEAWHDSTYDNTPIYEQLLAAAPDEPLFLASFALSSSRTGTNHPTHHARAREAAEKALLRAPDLADAHAALATVLHLENDAEGAARAAMRALELAPSLPEAHTVLGVLLTEIGRALEGLERLELTMRIQPRLAIAWSYAARVYDLLGDRPRADELLAAPPGASNPADAWLVWTTRLRVAVARGREDAERLASAYEEAPPASAPFLAWIPRVLRREIEKSEIERALTGPRARAGVPRVRAGWSMIHAELAAYLGDVEAAEAAVASADGEGLADAFVLDRSPLFAALRGRRLFDEVRTRIAARAARIESALRHMGLATA
jgi:tetratricopeptide (TPR) repeat protein